MTYKDFDAALREKSGGRPEFKIGGQTFTCRAKLPWKKVGALILQLTSGANESGMSEVELTEKFFNTVLIQADRARFKELLNKGIDDDDDDDEDIAGYEELGELLDWLIFRFTGIGTDPDAKEESNESNPNQPVEATATTLPEGVKPEPVKMG